MQGFFKSWRFRIIAVVALLVLGLMLRAATSGGLSSLPGDAVSYILTPVQRASAQLSNAATGFFARFTQFDAMKTENARLKSQVQKLTSETVETDELKRQNEQYQQYLGLREANPDLKFVSCTVVSRLPAQWYSSFTVDKGSADGVGVNDPVITADGLVGRVSTLSAYSSVVTTILDPSIQVSARVSRTTDACVAQGDSDLMQKGQLYAVYIPKSSLVTVGDIVVTSGTEFYPKGLRIGTVSQMLTDRNMSKYAVLTPMTDLSQVSSCFVITSFRGKSAGASSSSSSSSGSSK